MEEGGYMLGKKDIENRRFAVYRFLFFCIRNCVCFMNLPSFKSNCDMLRRVPLTFI